MTRLTHWEGEPTEVLARLWGAADLEVHERVGSTNDRARELARSGAAAFTVVIAEEQVTGRGRSGRRWHSPPGGGLWMSVLLPGPPPGPHLPLLVGLAAARAIERACSDLAVGIEWPNDLQAAGGKLGGVLCETSAGGIVAGVGVNVCTPPDGYPRELVGRATSLEAAGCGRVGRPALAGALVRALRVLCDPPAARLGRPELAELAARDALRGRPVVTEQAGEGTAQGVERDGALVLERPDGSRVRVVAGSVRPA